MDFLSNVSAKSIAHRTSLVLCSKTVFLLKNKFHIEKRLFLKKFCFLRVLWDLRRVAAKYVLTKVDQLPRATSPLKLSMFFDVELKIVCLNIFELHFMSNKVKNWVFSGVIKKVKLLYLRTILYLKIRAPYLYSWNCY